MRAAESSPKPVMVTRLYSGSDGLSHVGEFELKLKGSPYGQDVGQSEPAKAETAYIVRALPGHTEPWHNADHRRYIVALSGVAEVEIGNGEKVTIQPSRLYLAEDLTGKGHTFRVVGKDAWIALFVDLD